MDTHRDLLTAAGSVSSSSCSSSPLHTAEILEKERKSSSPSSVISSTTNTNLIKINNSPTKDEEDNISTDEKDGSRFDDDDDDDVSIWEDNEGRFRVTKISTTINRRRKPTPQPVFTDFFLNDEIKSNQQPPPPRHPEEEYPDETTQLGLGRGPYIPIKKTRPKLTKRGDDEDPDLELSIVPPIQNGGRECSLMVIGKS